MTLADDAASTPKQENSQRCQKVGTLCEQTCCGASLRQLMLS